MKKSQNLKLQRNLIMEIDEEICLLLAERQKVTREVQKLKAEKNLPKEDLAWEEEQNLNLQMLGKRYHLNSHMLVEVWDKIRSHVKKG
ncbi:MAG: chorismate mutase [Pseudomonadota bacterium]|nr:chorismate mutase [Pseudomonadota bacterium]